jgi:hypothetical protein
VLKSGTSVSVGGALLKNGYLGRRRRRTRTEKTHRAMLPEALDGLHAEATSSAIRKKVSSSMRKG